MHNSETRIVSRVQRDLGLPITTLKLTIHLLFIKQLMSVKTTVMIIIFKVWQRKWKKSRSLSYFKPGISVVICNFLNEIL